MSNPAGRGWESASVTLLPDGRIRAATGSSAQGQGRETAVAQIAAQALGLAPEAVEVTHGDTDTVPDGIGALASRSTPVGGAAMWRACAAFLSLATDAAARHLNRAADGLHAGAAGLTAPDGSHDHLGRACRILARTPDRIPAVRGTGRGMGFGCRAWRR
jgi:aerobic carbon-monoxide dehydrogenase large subunit